MSDTGSTLYDIIRRIAALALLVAVLVTPTAAQTAPASTALPRRAPPEVGRPSGDLVLPTLDGSRTVDLATYRGRKVLLIEFASW